MERRSLADGALLRRSGSREVKRRRDFACEYNGQRKNSVQTPLVQIGGTQKWYLTIGSGIRTFHLELGDQYTDALTCSDEFGQIFV
jgi:hypothetical protein